MLETLIPIAVAFAIVTVSPGPANLAAATVAMRSGRRTGLRFAAGLSLGLALWGLVAATGLGAVLKSSAQALTVLKVIGGAYLLWLAVQAGRSAWKGGDPSASSTPNTETASTRRWFRRGLILNLSNPKAVLAWMAALSMGLSADSSLALVAVATALCMALGVINYIGYALAFSTPLLMQACSRTARWIDGAVAALFGLAGFGLLRSAAERSP
ncbi:MAG: LysE family translocator [Devosiaceae bacterium]|nr:LysE family translocator [Devosiaceae bacterium MH13]